MTKFESVSKMVITGPARLLGVGLLAEQITNGRATLTISRPSISDEFPLIRGEVLLRGGTISSFFEPEKFYTFLYYLNLLEVCCTEADPFVITVDPPDNVTIIAYVE